jgi:molecular chaperone DnaK (HSP70)
VRELAEKRFGAKIGRAVISQSVNAPPKYRDAMMRAARIAHLNVVEMISEPVAGALALDLHTAPADRNIIICDFGGGTFDVSAVQQRALAFTPIAAVGDQFLGGDDLDHALAEAIAGNVFHQSSYDMHRDAVRWSELLLRCESAKRQLSTQPKATLAMREAYRENGQARDLSLTLERAWVDSVWNPLIERARGAIIDTLIRASWRPDQVDVIGIIGGSSRVPAVRAMISKLFGGESKLLAMPAPELTVARGATLLTARHRAFATTRLPTLTGS